jgi:hypothetical protein
MSGDDAGFGQKPPVRLRSISRLSVRGALCRLRGLKALGAPSVMHFAREQKAKSDELIAAIQMAKIP